MRVFPAIVFGAMRWAARKGLRENGALAGGPGEDAGQKARNRARGIQGETYAYWYLRRSGYVMIARNYVAPGCKGEVDLIGYDGPTLAFVEVRTRTAGGPDQQSPEESVTREKWRAVGRVARRFLAERGLTGCAFRFDLLAIENRPGQRPGLRLHRGAFSD
jgi:putative endonuclease